MNWSTHDDAWHRANLIHGHIRGTLLFLFACGPPRSRLGLNFFKFFVQTFLQTTSTSSHSC
jgi:hypothetical protein